MTENVKGGTMRKRFSGTWALVLMLALLAAGCGGNTKGRGEQSGGGETSGDGETAQEEKRMSTPEDTFNMFKEAVASGEFEKMYDCFSSKQQKQYDAQVPQLQKAIAAHLNKPADKAKLAKLGITDEKIKNMKGRDVMRISLAMGQVMAEMFTPKGKPVPDTVKEMQAEIAKTKLVSSKINADGKTAVVVVQNPKGKTEDSQMVLENGQWKLEEKENKKQK